MHIFLDESGTFVGHQKGSISVVGALVVPDGNLRRLRRRFARIRPSLLKDVSEVKGRLLGEHDVNKSSCVLLRPAKSSLRRQLLILGCTPKRACLLLGRSWLPKHGRSFQHFPNR